MSVSYYDKNDLLVRDAKFEDIDYLKDHLRQSDIDEVWASHNYCAEEALRCSLAASRAAYTILHKGVPIAMYGVAPTSEPLAASVWMLATKGLRRVQTHFLKICPFLFSILFQHYPVLFNFVDARNTTSINWLKWCGAKFLEPAPYGKEQLPFRFFVIRKETPECVHP